MIPNMLSEWDGNSDPQSPTIVLDIKFPFLNGSIADSTSREQTRPHGDFSFRLEIKMPTGQVSSPFVSVPVENVRSVDTQIQSAQELEAALKERLQQQRLGSSNQPVTPIQRGRSILPPKPLTPPSTSHSERFSVFSIAEHPIAEAPCDQMICDVPDTQGHQERSTDHAMKTSPPEDTSGDKVMGIPRSSASPLQLSSTMRPPHPSTPPIQINSRRSSRACTPPGRFDTVSRGRDYQSRSRSFSRSSSNRRGRTNSPASRRSRSIESQETRRHRRFSRSPVRNRSLHDRSHSPSSPSRDERDSYKNSWPRSTSSTLYSDELAVERVSSTQYSRSPSPAPIRSPSGPSGGTSSAENTSKLETRPPLQLRISEDNARVAPKLPRRRTCPFFHPTDKDRHPLDRPHPGYSIKEFDEAVHFYEKGETLPGRLVKDGVTINPKNRPPRSPVKFPSAGGNPTYVPLEYRVSDRGPKPARSRSPNVTPTKRRKISPQNLTHPQGPFIPKERNYGNYNTYPKATSLQATSPFSREGPPPSPYYEAKRQGDDFPNNRIGGNDSGLRRPQRPTYERRFPSQQSNKGYYRAQ